MILSRRLIPIALAALALAGCAARDVVRATPPPGYVADAAERVAGIDWTAAEVRTVRLSEYAFEPDALAFEAGKPYRLRLENTGAADHTFVSKGFFQAIAAAELRGGGESVANPYVEAIAVAPGEVRELLFVAVRPGRWELECTQPGHALFGREGTITVR